MVSGGGVIAGGNQNAAGAVLFIGIQGKPDCKTATQGVLFRWIMKLHAAKIAAAMSLLLFACGEDSPESMPPEVRSFLDKDHDLGFEIEAVHDTPDWEEGKRWRATTASGERLLIYEKDGAIDSVRKRADGSLVWDRQGNHKQQSGGGAQ